MRGLILVLMSNVCYLTVILIFLAVTWWFYLVVTAGYCSLPGDYWLLLVPAFSLNVYLICLSEY